MPTLERAVEAHQRETQLISTALNCRAFVSPYRPRSDDHFKVRIHVTEFFAPTSGTPNP